jgi:hypothetical protein
MSILDWTTTVKQTLAQLTQPGELLSRINQIPLEDVVVIGQRLWWISKRVTSTLDVVKTRLREEALKRPLSETCRFDGSEGSFCFVVPQSTALLLRQDANIKGLKKVLGIRFPEFFDETLTYTPVKDFQVKVAACTPEEQKALLLSVDLASRTPRVIFKD